MNQLRIFTVLCAALAGFSLLSGCNQNPAPQQAPATQAAAAADPTTQPITLAVTDFMDAIIKGETQRASARLTPMAMQRIINGGQQFAPPGFHHATFKIAEIRTPELGKAYVQCVLTIAPPGEQPRSEELCWVLKQVENDWRVAGFAAWGGPNGTGMHTDLETGNSMPLRDPSLPTGPATTPGLPPRMATDPATTAPR